MKTDPRRVCDECESPKTADLELKTLTGPPLLVEGGVPLWRIEVCDECFEYLIEEGIEADAETTDKETE